MRLSELKSGETGIIVKIHGHGAFRKRVIEMGFVKGKSIKSLLSAPLRDPIKYSIMGYEVSLRRSEAHLVEIIPVKDLGDLPDFSHLNVIDDSDADDVTREYRGQSRTINVVLIGNPNCGKTSLFNIASGSREHVGNYSGVTVDAKAGVFEYGGYCFNIVDLPGTYSLSAYSPEELYVRRYLKDENPDVIINVVDASNIERNLYLTTELIDMDRSMVIALNMYDEFKRTGAEIDYRMLGDMIGVPIVPTVSRNGNGIGELFETVVRVYEGREASVRHVHVNLGSDIEAGVRVLKDKIKADGNIDLQFSPRYLAIKFLEKDTEVDSLLKESPDYDGFLTVRERECQRIERLRDEDITSAIANEKYGFIAGALAETMVESDKDTRQSTRVIDAMVTNKLFGFPIFLMIMFVIFWMTFTLGAYPMEWIEAGVKALGHLVETGMPDGPLKSLLADGIIGGVGGVIVFLPNILILYFFISFMEDSGYMARAAFIMDKMMHKIGLHGKSFIPLVMGFGCNVPALLASRAIESKSSRIITILINPFMSCSARLPIYLLLAGVFFPNTAPLVLFGLYILGIFVAVITAKLLRRVYFKADETPFVMELPPYRMPTMKTSLRHMWDKGAQYLRKMGGIILFASIVVWALNYFPHHDDGSMPTGIVASAEIDPSTDSFLEMVGKAVNPLMEPIGFHWRATVAIVAGIPAKEIVVSTLGVVQGVDEFTLASALGFMVFVLLYCPCIASVTAIIKETGDWRYGAFSVVYNTMVAWLAAFIVYHIALIF
ncbi:MAG: ferrous iron transport protein B [Muribaculaceae bacterium]|nr:ferrous iron transport protein B [Muribaculaceae bacterium]